MDTTQKSQWTLLERAIRKDRAIVLVALFLLTLLAWGYLGIMAVDMSKGDMSLMGMQDMEMSGEMGSMKAMGSMEAMPWTTLTFVLMFVMWWVMMVGMMIPSATPMILLYAQLKRRSAAPGGPLMGTALFTLGYALAWAVFSLVAVALQWLFNEASWLSPMMVSTSQWLGAALFITAGVYQMTPLKRACLRHCRSPAHFLSAHWRPGTWGALRIGIDHGVFCVGCCWFLMGLLFFGGVMNLLWVAAIAGFVIVEKLLPGGELVARISGLLMLAYGIVLLV